MRRSVAVRALAISLGGAGMMAVLQLFWATCPEPRSLVWERRIVERLVWLPGWAAVLWAGGFLGLQASARSAEMPWLDAVLLGAVSAIPCALAARAFCAYLGAEGVLLVVMPIVALVCAAGSGALR